MIHINFADVPDSFEPLPVGVYDGVITEIEERESQSSEHPYLNWTITIVGGEYDNRKVWLMTSMSPKALWKLRDILIGLGVDAESLKSADFSFNPADFINVQVRASVVHENYQGRLRDRVETLELAEQVAARVIEEEAPEEGEGEGEEVVAEEAPAPAPVKPPPAKPAAAKPAGARPSVAPPRTSMNRPGTQRPRI